MVTFTNLTAQNDTVDRTTYTTASVSPTGNRLVLLSVAAFRNTGSAQIAQPTVSGGGMTSWALVDQAIVDSSGTDRANMWVFRALQSSPGSGTISIGFAVTLSACSWSVDQTSSDVDTSGTNGSGAVVQFSHADDDGSGTSVTVNYPSVMTSGNCGFFAASWQATGGATHRTDWIELMDVVGGLCALETQYRDGTDTAGSATHSPSRSGAVVLEIKAALSSIPGTASIALPALQVDATGASTATGTAGASLAPLQATANAAIVVTGLASVTLPVLAEGTVGVATVTGDAAVGLPAIMAVNDATASVQGTAEAALPSLLVVAGAIAAVDASVGVALPALQIATSGDVSVTGTVGVSLQSLQVAANGSVAGAPNTASVDVQLSPLQSTSDGDVTVEGTVGGQLPSLQSGVAGQVVIEATVAAVLPVLLTEMHDVGPYEPLVGATITVRPSGAVATAQTGAPTASAQNGHTAATRPNPATAHI